MFRMIHNINNGALTGPRSMPQKDLTSNNESDFQLARHNYIESYHPKLSVEEKQIKKWYGNKDASSVIANRRNNSVGVGSLNASGGLYSMTTYKDNNYQRAALNRVRSGGYTVPPKVYNKHKF